LSCPFSVFRWSVVLRRSPRPAQRLWGGTRRGRIRYGPRYARQHVVGPEETCRNGNSERVVCVGRENPTFQSRPPHANCFQLALSFERAKMDPYLTLDLVVGTWDGIFFGGRRGRGLNHRFFQLQEAWCFVSCDSLLNFCGT